VKILVIHGPNLRLLGRREPDIYGPLTLEQINESIRDLASELTTEVEIAAIDGEGEMVARIADSIDWIDGIVINPAAYTHTSVAVRDAISASGLPAVEVHLSNVSGREDFRQRSLTAPVCIGQISGFGPLSYLLGLRALVEYLQEENEASG